VSFVGFLNDWIRLERAKKEADIDPVFWFDDLYSICTLDKGMVDKFQSACVVAENDYRKSCAYDSCVIISPPTDVVLW